MATHPQSSPDGARRGFTEDLGFCLVHPLMPPLLVALRNLAERVEQDLLYLGDEGFKRF